MCITPNAALYLYLSQWYKHHTLETKRFIRRKTPDGCGDTSSPLRRRDTIGCYGQSLTLIRRSFTLRCCNRVPVSRRNSAFCLKARRELARAYEFSAIHSMVHSIQNVSHIYIFSAWAKNIFRVFYLEPSTRLSPLSGIF